MSEMILYRGVVEDNKDPNEIGRVKVRIHGIHTEKNENAGESFSFVSTADLPWAEVMGPNAFGLVGGVGISSVLHQGTWVWIMLEMGDPNKPVIVGTMTGVNSASPVGKAAGGSGFFDPAGVHPDVLRAGESDINEIARGAIANTVVKTKNDALDTSGTPYTEVAQAASSYPDNNVIESASGHMFEMDDTPGNERVQIIDKQGNYIEMKLNEYIDKAVADKINLVMGELKEHVVGNQTMFSDANVTWTVGGNFTLNVAGKIDIDAGPEIDLDAGIINLN